MDGQSRASIDGGADGVMKKAGKAASICEESAITGATLPPPRGFNQ
jgi:hypothetical protein